MTEAMQAIQRAVGEAVHQHSLSVVDALLDVLEGKGKMNLLARRVDIQDDTNDVAGRERDRRIRRLRKALGNEPQD